MPDFPVVFVKDFRLVFYHQCLAYLIFGIALLAAIPVAVNGRFISVCVCFTHLVSLMHTRDVWLILAKGLRMGYTVISLKCILKLTTSDKSIKWIHITNTDFGTLPWKPAWDVSVSPKLT